MNGRFKLLGCVAAVLAAGVLVRAVDNLRIVPIVSEKQVLVSIDLADAYTDEVRQAISSGLKTTFTYDVDLRMYVPAWVDRTVASVVVTTSDQYDNLARRHSLSRIVDGRVEEALVTEDETVVRRWLTTLSRLVVCQTSKLDSSRDYYVRISARARPRSASFLGLANTISGQAKFTFIP
jgi:Domain of unknown function (DUF4390)